MAKKTNKEIRIAMAMADVRQWEVAKAYGVAEATFCKLLREELPEEKKEKVMQIISDLAEER